MPSPFDPDHDRNPSDLYLTCLYVLRGLNAAMAWLVGIAIALVWLTQP